MYLPNYKNYKKVYKSSQARKKLEQKQNKTKDYVAF